MVYLVFDRLTGSLIAVTTDAKIINREFEDEMRYIVKEISKGEEVVFGINHYKYNDIITNYLS